MKKLLVLILLFTELIGTAQDVLVSDPYNGASTESEPRPTSTLYNGLVCWFDFQEGSGTIVKDAHIHALIGNISGAVLQADSSIYFDGNDDYIDIPSNPVLEMTDSITMVAIVDFEDTGNLQIVAGKIYADGSHSPPYFSYSLQGEYLNSTMLRARIFLGTSPHVISPHINFNLGSYNLIGGSFDRASSTLESVVNTSSSAYTQSVSAMPVVDTPLRIGVNGVKSEDLKGYLRLFAIWNRALTESEWTELYNYGIYANYQNLFE